MIPKLRLVRIDTYIYRILVDEGQDFQALYREFWEHDDKYTNGDVIEAEYMPFEAFMAHKGVKVLNPDNGDYVLERLSNFYPNNLNICHT